MRLVSPSWRRRPMCPSFLASTGVVCLLTAHCGGTAAKPTLATAGPQSVRVAAADKRVAAGTWGGDHVALEVTDAGGHLEFDCASGDVQQPLVVVDDARFGVDGIYVREHAGPIR